jgi:hypothetical protein
MTGAGFGYTAVAGRDDDDVERPQRLRRDSKSSLSGLHPDID